jgi:hypothetical protein
MDNCEKKSWQYVQRVADQVELYDQWIHIKENVVITANYTTDINSN